MIGRNFCKSATAIGLGFLAVGALIAIPAGTAQAARVLNGPIGLGTASTYAVLGASAITNTGPTVVTGDMGVSPQSSITGFTGAPNGSASGAVNDDNAPAGQAQLDLTTAFNDAASLTPNASGLAELDGMSLSPGVYSGGALSLANNGILTLAGTSANSVWVFQAASTLTIGSATQIVITGGASACNVFWEVGSSATIGTSAQFQGTVMASASISATTGATIAGRLLASNGAVTLQSNTVTVPPGCAPGNSPVSSNGPAITSGSPITAVVGQPYSFAITATGTPSPTFAVSGGTMPTGLALNSTTGLVSGTPSSAEKSSFTVTASNATGPVSATYSLTASAATKPVLALTGVDTDGPLALASALLLLGGIFMLLRRRQAGHEMSRLTSGT
jgi:LPXTG-motif cell wall-anchored protein